MSDKNLRFLLFGEDRTASKTFHHTADEAEGATGRIGGLFSKMGSTIGGEVGELVSKVGEGFEKLGEEAHGKLGAKLMAVGGIAGGVGVAMQAMASGDQAAHQQLLAAVEATGKGYEGYGEEVEKTIATQEKYGHKAIDTQEALRVLTQAFQDPKQAMEQMNLVSNLAAAKHISLADAAMQVAKVHGGAGRVLKEFGITMDSQKAILTEASKAQTEHTKAVDGLAKAQQHLTDLEAVDHAKKKLTIGDQIALRNAHEAVTHAKEKLKDSTEHLKTAQEKAKNVNEASEKALKTLGDRLKGQASAASDTFSGKISALRAHVEDVGASIAGKMGGALTTAGPAIAGVGAIVESGLVPKLLKWIAANVLVKEGSLAANIATKAWAAGQWLLNAAMDANPIGIVVLAIAALTAGIIYAYKHSETFRNIIQGAFKGIQEAVSFMWDNVLKPIFKLWLNEWMLLIGAIINGAADAFGWVPGLGPKLKAAQTWFNNFKDSVNASLDGIHAQKDINLNVITSIANKNAADKRIKGYATGTDFAPGGVALVGERGPELVNLPTGSKVTPADQTSRLLNGGALVHIENYNEAHQSPSQIAADFAFRLRVA